MREIHELPEYQLPEEMEHFKDVREDIEGKGVYFLFDDKQEVIYVGASEYLYSRVRGSVRLKEAKYVAIAHIDDLVDLDFYEKFYITHLKPKHNKDLLDCPVGKINKEPLDIIGKFKTYPDKSLKPEWLKS